MLHHTIGKLITKIKFICLLLIIVKARVLNTNDSKRCNMNLIECRVMRIYINKSTAQ